MPRIPLSPPQIASLQKDIARPYWSVMIPAYNCSGFLPEAIKSVLAQDPGKDMMQIEVVDDCSTDADIASLVDKIGQGRVLYFKQDKNVGSLRNFETCINRSKGHHIHLLHGDDKVKPGFYHHLRNLFENHPSIGAAFCAWNYIDGLGEISHRSELEAGKPGILLDWLPKLVQQTHIQYVAIAVKREVYEKIGAFYGVIYGEDWEMWARIAKHYPMAYTPEVLAEYRQHGTSISSQSFLTGKNIKDISQIINKICGYLPKEEQKSASFLAHKNYINWAFNNTNAIWFETSNRKIVYSQLKEINKVHNSSLIFLRSIKLMTKVYTILSYRFLKKKIKNLRS